MTASIWSVVITTPNVYFSQAAINESLSERESETSEREQALIGLLMMAAAGAAKRVQHTLFPSGPPPQY